MPFTIGKCKLFRIEHTTLLEGKTFLRKKHKTAFFLNKVHRKVVEKKTPLIFPKYCVFVKKFSFFFSLSFQNQLICASFLFILHRFYCINSESLQNIHSNFLLYHPLQVGQLFLPTCMECRHGYIHTYVHDEKKGIIFTQNFNHQHRGSLSSA